MESNPRGPVPRTDEGNIPEVDDVFSCASIVNFNDDKVKFDANSLDNPNDNYGSASGFLPKSPHFT